MSLSKTLIALALASTASAGYGRNKEIFCSSEDEEAGKCNCQDLPAAITAAGTTLPLTTTTSWKVQPEQIITYPCSTDYLGNAAANYMLEQNVQDATTELGKTLLTPGSKNCGYKCDFDNGVLKTADTGLDDSTFKANNKNSILKAKKYSFGKKTIYTKEELDFLCGENPGQGTQAERTGPLDKWWIGKNEAGVDGFGQLVDGLSACDCKQGVTFGDSTTGNIASGCYKCTGTVKFGITKCFDVGGN